jgi:hypothetical protein
VQEIRWNAPHAVCPLLENGRTSHEAR